MKILVIGSGGREHALVWKLQQSEQVERIFCIPGNAGISEEPKTTCDNLESASGVSRLRDFALREKIDLTVVGPEVPLAEGIANSFEEASLKIVGPRRESAQLESSKIFAKEFMARHKIPTADYLICDTADQALDFVQRGSYGYPVVIKADGLAAGKGVVLAKNYREAESTVLNFMTEKTLGDAGARVVVEECLQGRECSFMVFSDGESYISMVPSQDHKRVFDHDQGPNTGGMGAFSDDLILDRDQHQWILRKIVEPTLQGMRLEGRPFKGILYCGLMLTDSGPQVLEFNCRFGDPETQPVLMRMKSDLADVLSALAEGNLKDAPVQWSSQPSVCVVLTSGGYPGKYEKGKPIEGLAGTSSLPDVKVFHAGTKFCKSPESNSLEKRFETAGGRVLGVTAIGSDLKSAAQRAYQVCSKIHFEGMHYRRDIAVKPLPGQSAG